MKNAPPAHQNHFHMIRQYDSPNYVVYETIINRVGDSFRMWIPKGVLVDDNIGMFPTFFSKNRGEIMPHTRICSNPASPDFGEPHSGNVPPRKRKSPVRRKRARSRN